MNSDSTTVTDSGSRSRGTVGLRIGIISVFILVSLFLTYIGLTSTEVGRDYLRQELEASFAENFTGHMEIATISANPLRRILIQDISFYDENQNQWLHIEQITAQPNWETIFGGKFKLGSLTIIAPSLSVEYRADSTWNLSHVLSRRQSNGSIDWEFESTSISVSGGNVSISYEEHAPPPVSSGWLYDVSQSMIDGISLEGHLNLQANRRLFSLESFNASIDTLDISANGELLHDGNLVHINSLNLSSSLNQASIVGVLSITDRIADLSLISSTVSQEFAQVISPKIQLPSSVSLSGHIHQDTDQWLINDYTISTDLSRIEISSAQFKTSKDIISFQASIEPSTLNPDDLQSMVNTSQWRGGEIQIDGQIQGNTSIDDLDLSGSLRILTKSGGITHLHASATRNDRWSYDANLITSRLNLNDLITEESLQGIINGSLNFSGVGIGSPSLFGSLVLSSSEINGHSVDSLSVEASVNDQQLRLRALAVEEESQIMTELSADWATHKPSYQSTGVLSSVDLGSLLNHQKLETKMNAVWEMSGAGRNLDDLAVNLEIKTDSSLIAWNETQLNAPPTVWSIHLQDTSATENRLRVESDVLDITVSGTIVQHSINHIGPLWSNAFEQLVDRFDNRFYSNDSLITPDHNPQEALMMLDKKIEQSAAITSAPIELNFAWQLHGHSAINPFLPFLPEFNSQSTGEILLKMDGESFELDSQFQDKIFQTKNLSLHQINGSLSLGADLAENIESNWDVGLTLTADSINSQSISTQAPSISLNQTGETGILEIHLGNSQSSLQGFFSSNIHLMADRLQLQVQDMQIPIGDDIWTISQKTDIEFLDDATVINPLQLLAVNPLLEEMQTVTIQGKLSSMPEDTLHINLAGVDLNHISNTFEFRRSLAGQVDADLLWTGLWQPEITGTLEVDTLVFANRIIGNLIASSTLLPGSPDLKFYMAIDSISAPSTSYIPLTNQVELSGDIIVDTQDRQGVVDLNMDVQRLDASLLTIFLRDQVEFDGGFTGKVVLRGPINQLAFDGSLLFVDGGFSIPRFNSSYETIGEFDLLGDQILFDQILVDDRQGGRAEFSGALNFNNFRFISFDASTEVESLQIMNVLTHRSGLPFYGDLRVTGDATLTGPIYSSFLRSDNLIVTPQSELYIPVRNSNTAFDPGFIIFADSTESIEQQFATITRARQTILHRRPEGERTFRDGLDIDLNLLGPPGSNIRLVIDPLLGDVINGIGSARVQIQRTGGEISTYGSFEISSGDYLFTAGEIFVRRFLIDSGTIIWNGPPLNPILDISGAYQTRASRSGLPDDVGGAIQTSLPLIVNLDVSGTLNAVLVDLNLEVDQRQEAISETPLLDTYLNRPDLATEHATSVLLTNSFLLSANSAGSDVLASSAVNSVSSLVGSQLNRYLSQVIPQADFRIGLQSDETIQDLDVSAGIALRLLNERLVIRGQGVYRGLNTEEVASQGLQGEFIVEIQLSPSVSIEFFYRREGDVLSESLITREVGVGLNYRTEFTSWRHLFRRNVSDLLDTSDDDDL
ncbi:MAG: translocation/assembly module TamB domain-containing protein [Bacteroidetes bacterium]|nr:translocation/assembly module TamB domain-containing protein [Bacteroidota bacterium]